ncbi:hypothetical protein [Thiothrix subterranea]|uniref:hypothetical protein n=1 Tax=Thiothrix subterranea TaxID=2735563 RepID=UPI00403FD519
MLSIRLPPLRERGRDTEVLAQHFINRLATELGVMPLALDKSEILRLQDYAWPGNVRELKNVIERALLLRGHAQSMPDRYAAKAQQRGDSR